MDPTRYRQYLEEFVREAVENSGGTTAGAWSYLLEKTVSTGFLVQHKKEKNKALEDARQAFGEHRHWPLEIIISHLGIDVNIPNR